MAAYFKSTLYEFVNTPAAEVAGVLSQKLIQFYSGNHQEQLKAWEEQIAVLQTASHRLLGRFPTAANWAVLLEYPLLRLQRRLDTVALAGQIVAVIEFKVAGKYEACDVRQVEDYALDLRDFHQASHKLTIVPMLCATQAPAELLPDVQEWGTVWEVYRTNIDTLPEALERLAGLSVQEAQPQLALEAWDQSPYRPVPSIVEAAELLYAGHSVEEIAHAAADEVNLASTATRLIEIVAYAREKRRRVVCFVTGVPGSGKTLIGLNLVHDERIRIIGGNAAYLSGNTPLVEVLREALARDRNRRNREPLRETRRVVRTEIQHLMDYLREYIAAHPSHCPHEHVIVFDEAQRAWDAEYGKRKFDRAASEPALFLEIMGRRDDWAVIVGLVGGGQEINVGEGGLREWGDALAAAWVDNSNNTNWEVFAAPDVVFGGATTVGRALFAHSYVYPGMLETDTRLHLGVAVRNIQCESVSNWVANLLAGHIDEARKIAGQNDDFPVFLTRDLSIVRAYLGAQGRGNRRVGLVASSGARRLRADGLGVALSANERDAYVHWYLEPKGDIRSSNALEVTANEYTCQGLELDHVGLCWGGDMLWDSTGHKWEFRELHGPKWKAVRNEETQQYVRNTYRVLMTRARHTMVVWVPHGDLTDPTRAPSSLDVTAEILRTAGARVLGGDSRQVSRVTSTSPNLVEVPRDERR